MDYLISRKWIVAIGTDKNAAIVATMRSVTYASVYLCCVPN